MKKLIGSIPVEYPPLSVTSSINVTGGSVVQFYDGVNYTPNREGSPSSPIQITHNVSAVDPDGGSVTITRSTTFFEDDIAIASGDGYGVTGNVLLVEKNIPAGTAVVIKARTQFVDNRSGAVYERIDTVMLRTILKAEAQFQLELSQRGRVFFDGYRNPNVTTTVTAQLKQGSEEITDLTDITLKWLNSADLDAVENELYADAVSEDGRELTVDKTYIDHELITCEAWRDSELIASDTVTFIRKFNDVRFEDYIIGLPITPLEKEIVCTLEAYDMVGAIDVNAAFLLTWIVNEGGVEKELGQGTPLTVPVSSLNLKASSIRIYADVKQREAYAALTAMDAGEEVLLTDENDNVLTIETYGI
jgi:hypothetical protein